MESMIFHGNGAVYNSEKNYSGYAVIGAGLPRTGTLSTRHALSHLLQGPIYHMEEFFSPQTSVRNHPFFFFKSSKGYELF